MMKYKYFVFHKKCAIITATNVHCIRAETAKKVTITTITYKTQIWLL